MSVTLAMKLVEICIKGSWQIERMTNKPDCRWTVNTHTRCIIAQAKALTNQSISRILKREAENCSTSKA